MPLVTFRNTELPSRPPPRACAQYKALPLCLGLNIIPSHPPQMVASLPPSSLSLRTSLDVLPRENHHLPFSASLRHQIGHRRHGSRELSSPSPHVSIFCATYWIEAVVELILLMEERDGRGTGGTGRTHGSHRGWKVQRSADGRGGGVGKLVRISNYCSRPKLCVYIWMKRRHRGVQDIVVTGSDAILRYMFLRNIYVLLEDV